MDTSLLELEITALREALRDTEDVCRAIKLGEVDAVVVGPDDDDKRVLLMSEAYARYRQLVEDMLQGAVTTASSGEILFANRSFAGMVGQAVDTLLGTPLERWVVPADHGRLRELLAPGGAQGEASLLFTCAGQAVAAHLSLVNASDDFTTLLVTPGAADAEATLDAIRSGSVDAFVVGREVMVLDSARSPYRALAERIRQGAVAVDGQGIVFYANERFVSMIAMPRGRVLGRPLADLVVEKDRATIGTMLESRDGAQAEVKLRCANGERPVVQATMSPVEGQKLFLFTDLTEQKRHQASDERTRRFLSLLAHEFRNILGPVGNAVQIVKRTQALDADGKGAVEILERQIERLLGLVEELGRINPKE